MIARLIFGLVMVCVASLAGAQSMPMKTTLKGLNTDGRSPDDVAGNETGWVTVPFVWHTLVGDDESAAHYTNIDNCTAPDVKFTAYGITECFRYSQVQPLDDYIQQYNDRGVRVIGVFIGTPRFARISDAACQGDTHRDDGSMIWCAPATDGTRDAHGVAGTTWAKVATRFLAHRYGPLIRGWVIGNEVNHADWFRTGCLNCSGAAQSHWMDLYAGYFNGSYDGVVDGYADETTSPYARLDGGGARIVPRPPVMVSMTGAFDTPWDIARSPVEVITYNPDGSVAGSQLLFDYRQISEKTFLRGLNARAGGRLWRVAQHAYPRDIWVPIYNVDDLTRAGPRDAIFDAYAWDFGGAPTPAGAKGGITHATTGAVVAFLRAEFPWRTDLWHIFMTEGGFNTNKPAHAETEYPPSQYPEVSGPDFEGLQVQALCDAFADYTGTPGIDVMIYHRMRDHPLEGGLKLGLSREDGTEKPAWPTFALSNRYAAPGVPPPSCGFQYLPYTRLQRASGPQGHRNSSRVLPSGFTLEAAWYLFRDERPNSQMLYECWMPNNHSFATRQANCENRAGALNLGPIGFAYTPDQPRPATDSSQWVQLYACNVAGVTDIVTTDPNCEGWPPANPLGWARTTSSNADDSKYTALRRSSAPAGPPFGIPEHWTTTIQPPPHFAQEATWWILREPAAGTKLFYECEVVGGGHSMPSEREDCEGHINRGPLGYIAQSSQGEGSVPLYRCGYAGIDHMVTSDPNCELWFKPAEVFLGYSSVR